MEDESNAAEAAILSLSEAAKKMDPSHLGTFLDELLDKDWMDPENDPEKLIFELIDYYGVALSQVWVNMLEEYSLSKLIHVPLSLIPRPIYEISIDFINVLSLETLTDFVPWASDLILTEWPGVVKVVHPNADISKVATFVVLAMVLRAKPDALTLFLPKMREEPTYQGQDKLPFVIWIMAQAFQDDLPAGLYSWACNLLPLVANNEECYSSQSVDLILQFVEMILSSNPKARDGLLTIAVIQDGRLIPPRSFEMLVRLTFPAPSARVEATERFEAIYPLLKEVALAFGPNRGANALEQIFIFSLELAGGQGIGNPALANEATAIAISVLTQNFDCFKQWDVLYKENLEASVALLKKLVDEWKDRSLYIASSDILTVKHAMNSFRMKNEKSIIEGVANLSLYKDADQSCKLISRRLSRGRGIAPLTEKGEETEIEKEAAILSLSEAAKKTDPSHLGTFLDELLNDDWFHPEKQILKLIDYCGVELSQVSFQWVNMFEHPLSNLIDVPLSLIPTHVYKISIDFIKILPFETLTSFVLRAFDLILTEWLGIVTVEHPKVATVVVLAMVLRTKPDALTPVLPKLRERPTYQGQDKLSVLIWMMAQASQGDLCAGLYLWVRNLLPLVANNKDYRCPLSIDLILQSVEMCYSSQSVDLILQFVEMILSSNREARDVLLNRAVTQDERLIPPCLFAMLVRLTFPAPSARVEATERFEAIYPLLKEVALAFAPYTGANALEQIFTFSLKLAGEQGIGNPALASEATAIAIRVLTENVDCFLQWDVLYKKNLEASVALLKKLVDEWKDHSHKLSSSSSDTLTVKHAMISFRMKNEKAIHEGVANLSLYEDADKSCKLISRRLSRGPGIALLTAMVIAAAVAAAGGVVGKIVLSNLASGKKGPLLR